MELKLAGVTFLPLLFIAAVRGLKFEAAQLDRSIQILSNANLPWDDQLAKKSNLSLVAFKAASSEVLHSELAFVEFHLQKFDSVLYQESVTQCLDFYLKMIHEGTLFFERISTILAYPSTIHRTLQETVKARFDCLFQDQIIAQVKALKIPGGQFAKYAKVYSCSQRIVTSLTLIDPFGLIQHWINTFPHRNTPTGIDSFIEHSSRTLTFKHSAQIIEWYAEILDNLGPHYQPYCTSGNLVTSLLIWRMLQLLHSCSAFNVQNKIRNYNLGPFVQGFIESKMKESDIHTQVLGFLLNSGIRKLLIELLNSLSIEEFVKYSQLTDKMPQKMHVNGAVDYTVASLAIISCMGIGTGWFIYLKFYLKQ